MSKYKRKYLINEGIPNSINDFELSLLLLEFKIIFTKANDFIKFKELSNSLSLRLILNKLYKFSDDENKIVKKVLSRINKNFLYKFYIKTSCDLLLEKNFDILDEILKSFVATGLVKYARVSNPKAIIKIILPDDTEVKYTHIQLDKELLDAYKGNCHMVTSVFLKNCERTNGAAVVLENNELFGKYYHSFLLENGVMHDLAHNIMMKYEDYLKLINPTVLINGDKNTILNSIKELENNNKSFVDSEYVDLLKYAMNNQQSNLRSRL